MPALDGLRAIALLAVLAFHAGYRWIHGGYLPLTAFFVLSGFLITALLLAEQHRAGAVSLGAFWARRARRLVPAALLGMALVAAYLAFGAEYEVPGVEGDLLASLGWVTNWRFILSGRSYADAFADPSPLQHYWSLAVEEQFYVVLPLLAVGMLAVGRGRRWPFAAVVAGLATASVLTMRALHDPGDPPLRAYFGTDTRAAELLVGVLLACVLVSREGRLRTLRGGRRIALEVAGVAALAASVWLWFTTEEFDDRLYEGGLLGIALLAAVVVAAVTQPGSIVGRVLGLAPLAWLGRISYGIYLFHWPLFLWLDEDRTGLDQTPLFALRLAVTVALAWLSFHFVETPIREGRIPGRIGLVGWANGSVAVAGVLAVAAAALPGTGITLRTAGEVASAQPVFPTTSVTSPTTTVPDGAMVAAGTGEPAQAAGPGDGASPPGGGEPPATTTVTPPAAPTDDAGETPGSTAPAPPTTPPPPPAPAPKRVLVIGDSVAQNLATGLTARTRQVGDVAVLDLSLPACSIARDGDLIRPSGEVVQFHPLCNTWPTRLQAGVRDFQPDVVLVQGGLAELNDRRTDWAPHDIHFGDPYWDNYVLEEFSYLVDLATTRGAQVVWTTAPCVDWSRNFTGLAPEDGNSRLGYLNGVILPRLQARRPSIRVEDLYAQLCPGGAFTDTVAGVSQGRPDGTHLSDTAAAALVDRWLIHRL